MKIQSLFVLVFVFLTTSLSAQFETTSDTTKSESEFNGPKTKPQPTPLKERIVLGGGLDLQFGNYTVIGLTPLVGYSVTDKFLVGGIFTYRYIQDNSAGSGYSTSTYGVTPFARYTLFKGLFVHAEYEMLYGQYYVNDDPVWINSLLIGGGYGVKLGNRGFAGIYMLWNVTPDANYPIYDRPQVRMTFGVGL